MNAVNDYLKNNLTGYQKMERQGSYALGTLIKPVDDNDKYDADIQIVMNPNPQWEAKDYVLAVNRSLAGNKTYADKLRLKTRCCDRRLRRRLSPRRGPSGDHRRQALRLQPGRQQIRGDGRQRIP